MKQKLGIIGCGNMGGALAGGITGSGLFSGADTIVYDSATRFSLKTRHC